MQILGSLPPNLLNQGLWGWSPAIYSLKSPPGDSGICQNLNTIALSLNTEYKNIDKYRYRGKQNNDYEVLGIGDINCDDDDDIFCGSSNHSRGIK